MSREMDDLQLRYPVLYKHLIGADQVRDAGAFVEAVNAYSTGDIAATDLPTTRTEGEPERVIAGAPGLLRFVETARGHEGIDENGVTRILSGVLDGEDQQGVFLFDAGGLLQAALADEGLDLMNSDGTVSLSLRDGQIFAYDASGNLMFRFNAGAATNVGLLDLTDSFVRVRRDGVARYGFAVGLNADVAERTVIAANGGVYFGDGTFDPVNNASGTLLRHSGTTGRLRVERGGIGTSTDPLYAYVPQVAAFGPNPVPAAIGTTFGDVFSMSLTTTQTCNIYVQGFLRPRLNLGAIRNQAIQFRVTLGGVAQGGPAPTSFGHNADQVALPIAATFGNIAAGTHTITLQVRAVNTGDTIDFAAINVCHMFAQAFLA